MKLVLCQYYVIGNCMCMNNVNWMNELMKWFELAYKWDVNVFWIGINVGS